MNAFIYTPQGDDAWANNPGYVYQEDRRVVFVGDKADFREGLSYIAGLFSVGLIASDTLTMGGEQLKALGMAETQILGASAELFPGEFTVGADGNAAVWMRFSVSLRKAIRVSRTQEDPAWLKSCRLTSRLRIIPV